MCDSCQNNNILNLPVTRPAVRAPRTPGRVLRHQGHVMGCVWPSSTAHATFSSRRRRLLDHHSMQYYQKSMKINRNPWNQWQTMEINENQWKSMKIHCFLGFPMAAHGRVVPTAISRGRARNAWYTNACPRCLRPAQEAGGPIRRALSSINRGYSYLTRITQFILILLLSLKNITI